MNLDKINQLARERTPSIAVEVVTGTDRFDVISGLKGNQNKGIELGVASGDFSEKMVHSGRFTKFYGVDVYADIHDVNEYKTALRKVGIERDYSLLRMTFDQALDLFEEESLDFVYVDGYAHTGEEGGKTLIDWYQKLKVGGIMAGDDFHDDWPLVKWAVSHFVSQATDKIYLTDITLDKGYSHYPSWFFRKERPLPHSEYTAPIELVAAGQSERKRITQQRTKKIRRKMLKDAIKQYFGKDGPGGTS